MDEVLNENENRVAVDEQQAAPVAAQPQEANEQMGPDPQPDPVHEAPQRDEGAAGRRRRNRRRARRRKAAAKRAAAAAAEQAVAQAAAEAAADAADQAALLAAAADNAVANLGGDAKADKKDPVETFKQCIKTEMDKYQSHVDLDYLTNIRVEAKSFFDQKTRFAKVDLATAQEIHRRCLQHLKGAFPNFSDTALFAKHSSDIVNEQMTQWMRDAGTGNDRMVEMLNFITRNGEYETRNALLMGERFVRPMYERAVRWTNEQLRSVYSIGTLMVLVLIGMVLMESIAYSSPCQAEFQCGPTGFGFFFGYRCVLIEHCPGFLNSLAHYPAIWIYQTEWILMDVWFRVKLNTVVRMIEGLSSALIVYVFNRYVRYLVARWDHGRVLNPQ